MDGLVHPATNQEKRNQEKGGSAKISFRRLWAPVRNEHGSSLVEMALTLPVMLMVVTGICTFGIAMNQYLLLTDATNVGARQLAMSRGATTDPCSLVASAVSAGAPLLKASSLSYTIVLNGNTYNSATCTSGATNMVQGTTATVTVTYPCILKIYGANLVPSCFLTAKTAEMVL